MDRNAAGEARSRRFLGDHVLTQQDLEDAVLFDDRVAYGGWPIDTHPPSGIYAHHEPPCAQPKLKGFYSIPLRSLYSRNVANLFMAGRNISATHLAFASARVMATCAVEGQAVGTAAAIALQRGVMPRQLVASHISEVQQALLKDDAYIVNLPNADPADFARQAAIMASGEAAGHAAKSVIDGFTRASEDGSHLWASAEGAPLPQWLRLDLPGRQLIHEIRLTFDTNLSRPLALTYYEHLQERIVQGPQPETARDYRIEVLEDGEWRTLERVEGNYQRLRVHHIAPRPVDAVRVVVEATNGAPQARLFEVRIYYSTSEKDP